MNQTVWEERKPLNAIVTRFDDSKYFDKNKNGIYKLKEDAGDKNIALYFCLSKDAMVITEYRVILAGLSIKVQVGNFKEYKGLHLCGFPVQETEIDVHANQVEISVIKNTDIANTVILFQRDGDNYNQDEEWEKVFEVFDKIP